MESFAEHPMGRSLAPVAVARPVERFDATVRNPFAALGFQYSVEQRGQQVFHREVRRDAEGRVLTETECEVAFTVGSGSHGRSYLTERDGVLRMSPISWYPEKQIWDLSPGYTQQNYHFDRPILAECLFCHCNQAAKVPETINRFQTPIFRGYAIGCERCHGPGELHARLREQEEVASEVDHTIVNPKHLDPYLREAVCEQCHLQGQRRVPRRRRDTFDFRPGLPLHEFIAVFVKSAATGDDRKFVGQVEQMHTSRCFSESAGKLGCVSCHDPHRKPPPEERIAFYRQRCLICHADRGCSEPLVQRKAKSPEDSCIQCHMPRSDANITHTSISDHRVLRRIESESSTPRPATRPRPGELPLAYFHHRHRDSKDPSVQRDLAIALIQLADRSVIDVQKGALSQIALPMLTRATADDPEDLDALDGKAQAYWFLNRFTEAAEVLEQVLARSPEREPTLDTAATVYLSLRRYTKAIECWQKAVRINPHRWRYYAGLAAAHAHLEEWSQALHAADRALQLDPTVIQARMVRITALGERGQHVKAESEMAILKALDQASAEELRKRLESRKR
jgi:Flp pilus assembly protein TadD